MSKKPDFTNIAPIYLCQCPHWDRDTGSCPPTCTKGLYKHSCEDCPHGKDISTETTITDLDPEDPIT